MEEEKNGEVPFTAYSYARVNLKAHLLFFISICGGYKKRVPTWIFTLEMDILVVDCLSKSVLDNLSFPVRRTTKGSVGTLSTVIKNSPLPISVILPVLAVSGPDTMTKPASSIFIEDGPLLPISESISMAG